MKRAPVAIGATVAGIVGILSFHTKSTGSALLAAPVGTGTKQNSSGTGSSPTTSAPATTAPSGTSPQTSPPSSAATPATASSPAATSAPATTSPPSTSGSSSNATVTGTLEQYGYGQLAVKVTVSGKKILDVSVVNLQTAESYSQQLAQQVDPMLKSEVLSAQSAQINAISGATYTSQAYASSLQSALDQLNAG